MEKIERRRRRMTSPKPMIDVELESPPPNKKRKLHDSYSDCDDEDDQETDDQDDDNNDDDEDDEQIRMRDKRNRNKTPNSNGRYKLIEKYEDNDSMNEYVVDMQPTINLNDDHSRDLNMNNNNNNNNHHIHHNINHNHNGGGGGGGGGGPALSYAQVAGYNPRHSPLYMRGHKDIPHRFRREAIENALRNSNYSPLSAHEYDQYEDNNHNPNNNNNNNNRYIMDNNQCINHHHSQNQLQDRDKRIRDRMQRFGTKPMIISHDDDNHNNNQNHSRFPHNNNRYRRQNNNNNNNNNYNHRNNNSNRDRFGHRNRNNNNNNNNIGNNSPHLRMSPQYDSDGNQIMSMGTYQIRNNKYEQLQKLKRIENDKILKEKEKRKEEKKLEKWKIRQKQKIMDIEQKRQQQRDEKLKRIEILHDQIETQKENKYKQTKQDNDNRNNNGDDQNQQEPEEEEEEEEEGAIIEDEEEDKENVNVNVNVNAEEIIICTSEEVVNDEKETEEEEDEQIINETSKDINNTNINDDIYSLSSTGSNSSISDIRLSAISSCSSSNNNLSPEYISNTNNTLSSHQQQQQQQNKNSNSNNNNHNNNNPYNSSYNPYDFTNNNNDNNIKYEPNLDEKPLYLACSNKNWQSVIKDINRRSFAGYKPNPFSKQELDLWWDLMTKKDGDIQWKRPKLPNGRELPRKASWLVSSECKCCYRYSSTQWKPIVFPEWFEKITKRVLQETGLQFEYLPNSCNVNWYEDGSDSVGWHSDDESLFQSKYDDCLIISLSLGQSRKFEIKMMEINGNNDMDDMLNINDIEISPTIDVNQIILHNGDLMTMEGLFQKYYQHRVPRSHDIDKPRINFTWRWIKQHYFYRDNCRLYTHKGPGIVRPL